MERCKHDLLFCSECNTFGGDSLPQYESGTEQEVLSEMAEEAIRSLEHDIHMRTADSKGRGVAWCAKVTMRNNFDYAKIRDFEKLGGIDDE